MSEDIVSLSGARRSGERRTVILGVTVVVVALAFTYVLLPFARRWREREARLERMRAEFDATSALIAHRSETDAAANALERALSLGGRRAIRARSATLGANALQSFLQDAADASQLVVTRLDVANPVDERSADDLVRTDMGGGDAQSVGGAAGTDVRRTDGPSETVSVPASLSAYCDIVGLADLLRQLAQGPRVVRVDRLTVQRNSAIRGGADMLQITMSLRAPVSIQ